MKQVEAAEAFIEPGAWVPHLALVEATWVLASLYARDRGAIAAVIEMLVNHKTLSVQEPDTVAAALRLFGRHRGVTFFDYLMLEVAKNAGHAPLGAFARDLGRMAPCVYDGASRGSSARDGVL